MTNICMHFGGPIGPDPEVKAVVQTSNPNDFVVLSIEGSSLELYFHEKAGAYRFANAVTRAVANMEPSSQPDGPIRGERQDYDHDAGECEDPRCQEECCVRDRETVDAEARTDAGRDIG